MGTPTFYYYPNGGRSLETVDLGEGLQNLTATPAIRREDATALDGSMSTAVLGPMWELRLLLERFGSPGASALERQLQALANHLRRGGLCGVAVDSDKAWCGLRAGASTRGYTYCSTRGNAFAAWSAGAAVVASGDEVAVEGSPPDHTHEVRGVSSLTGSTIALSEAMVFDHRSGWVRHRDFWPVCYMRADDAAKEPITHDHRRNYTLDLRLVFSPAMLATALDGMVSLKVSSGLSSSEVGATHTPVGHSNATGLWEGLGGPAGLLPLGTSATPTYSSNGASLEMLMGRTLDRATGPR